MLVITCEHLGFEVELILSLPYIFLLHHALLWLLHHALLWLAPACLGGAEINVASILFCCTFVLPQHGVRSGLTIFSELRNLDKSDDGVLVRTGSRSGHAPEVFDNGRPTKKL